MLPANHSNSAMAYRTAPINRLDRLFDSLFEMPAFGENPGWPGGPMSLWRDEDHFYVEADLPGVSEQDIELTVHQDVLTIRGERKAAEDRRYLYDGRTWGRFERTITLPEKVQTDGVQAELKDGVLRVVLPVSPETKPRTIALNTK